MLQANIESKNLKKKHPKYEQKYKYKIKLVVNVFSNDVVALCVAYMQQTIDFVRKKKHNSKFLDTLTKADVSNFYQRLSKIHA